MHVEEIGRQLQKRRRQAGLDFEIGTAATAGEFDAVEARLGLSVPGQVRSLYETYGSISVREPPFSFWGLAEWRRVDPSHVAFCSVALESSASPADFICFDTRQLNAAGQWDIVHGVRRITFTIASLWSIHMWKWIDGRRPFWLGDR